MFALLKKIGVLLSAPLVAFLLLAGCEDDPILGPNDGDSNGGSYGNLRLRPQETSVDKSSVDKTSADKTSVDRSTVGEAGAAKASAATSPNPEIF